jgi:hypothetical protein
MIYFFRKKQKRAYITMNNKRVINIKKNIFVSVFDIQINAGHHGR